MRSPKALSPSGGKNRTKSKCELVRVTVHRGYGNNGDIRPMTDGTTFIDPPLPSTDRMALEAAFADEEMRDTTVINPRMHLCRMVVSNKFALYSLRAADRIVLGRSADGGIRGLITVYGPTHRHPFTGQPYCRSHELYLDVVCSYMYPKGCGAVMINGFIRHLRKREPAVRALRLHSCASARSMWRDRFGFVEADTELIETENGIRCKHTNARPLYYQHEEVFGWNRTWRMTKIIRP